MTRAAAAPPLAASAVSVSDLPAGEWPFVSRFLDVGGNRVHYVDEGRGPTLLFVHVGMWSFVWRDVIVRLSDRFRCVALDFPGTGFSRAAAAHRHTLPANEAVLESFVDSLGLTDVVLVLHDLGGPVGFGFAARRPELVRAFVITQTFAWPIDEYKWVVRMCRLMSGRTMAWMNRELNLVARMSKGRFGVGRRLSRAGRKTFLTPFRDKRTRVIWSELIGDPLRRRDELTRLDQALQTTLRDRPVLTVFGERNDPYGWQKRYTAMFDDATEVVIEKAMHFPFTEDPDTFASSIEGFLGRET